VLSFGLNYTDWRKIVWTFIQAALAYAVAAAMGWAPGTAWDWRTFAIGGLAAGWAAVKNFSLADESPIK